MRTSGSNAVTESATRQRQPRSVRPAVQTPAEALESRLLLSRDLYVDIASPGPTRDGSSWASAYADLQLAIAAAVKGDRILVADGTYRPTATTDRSISFNLKEGVSLYGGYGGYGAANPEARDITLYPSILSGDIGTPGTFSDNSYHVITSGSGITSATVFNGFTITAGNATDNSTGVYGGGMYAPSSSPTLVNCTFRGNAAVSGGGMYTSLSAPALISCAFLGNSAQSGGGMYTTSSPIAPSPTLTNCIFSGNVASSRGGGMYNAYCSPTLTNCTFSSNVADSSGAAIYGTSSSSPRLTNCIIWGGAAPFYATAGTVPVITYSDIQGGYSGNGNINVNPLFVRPPSAGPDGRFTTADDDYGDLRLRSGSPVLDRGANAAVPAGIGTDLAGNARVQNGTVDLGAYEGANSAPAGRTLHVDAAAAGANTGASWTDAFDNLQSALAAASAGDTIRVADGIYKPTVTTDRTVAFVLGNGVALYGGFAGFGAANPDARNPSLYPTILSGDIGKPGDGTDNSYHVVTGMVLDDTTVLDGFTITAGNANGTGADSSGGGIYNTLSSPVLANCILSGNSASASGGGMYNSLSSPALDNCSFTGNSSTFSGGGIYNSSSSPRLTGSIFTGNSALDHGAGVFNWGSSPILTGCIFSQNQATAGAGVTSAFSSAATLINCSFNGNSATTHAGAVCTFNSASATLTNCSFTGNSAPSEGGAIAIYFCQNSLTNCTFSSNSAATGGAVYAASSSSVAMTNCIVWGSGSVPLSISPVSTTAVITYGDIQGGYTGTGNINADPKFVRNPSSGPDGKWGTADDDYGDLRLQSGSPCIDAGNSAAPGLTGIMTDLAGGPRISGSAVDMGAYERDPAAPTITSISINDGATQRSMVKKISVFFSEPVTLSTGALAIRLASGAAVPNTTITLANPLADQRTYILTFSGTGAVGGSLADGIYDLSITATGVQDLAGNPLTADYTQRFHRLFGDVDGNRVVNALDYAKLKATYGRSSADPLFNNALDYEENNVINALDLAQFRKRYGVLYSY